MGMSLSSMHHEGPESHRPSDKSVVTRTLALAPSIPRQQRFRKNGSQPTMQFGLNPQYPLPDRQRAVEQSADIHRRVFWHDSILPAHIAAALRHATGSPGLGLLRRLRPVPARSAGSGPSPAPPNRTRGRAGRDRDGSRVHLLPINELGAQLYPGGPRDYAADLHPELSRPMASVVTGGPIETVGPRTAPRPRSTRFEPVPVNEASPLVSHVHLLVSLAGPAPSGGTGTFRLCQGRFHPHRHSTD